MVAVDWGEGVMRNNCSMGKEFPLEVMKMFQNKIEVIIAHCEHSKPMNCSLLNGFYVT